ncbi:MAG: hypothetical protein AB7O24_02235 [Kofleriaceae bacterium]
MAKKQTRRSISVSRTTYERLKTFCEANNISMSQLVETRVNDFLGNEGTTSVVPSQPRPTLPASSGASVGHGFGRAMSALSAPPPVSKPTEPSAPVVKPAVPMTSAAARFAVDPPPPIIKPKQETSAPKPAEKRPDQIFTF